MKKAFLFTCLFALLKTGIFAQSLSLETARLLALASSRSLAQHEMSIRTSILNEKNQLYTMLPSISAGYSASMNYMRDWEMINPVDTLRMGIDFSLTQIIFQGGKSFINKAINSISTETTRKNALAEYFNVLDSIDNAYYAVLEAAATLEAEESSLESAVLSLSIAEIRLASGMINQGDYLKALADKETRENSRNQARRNLALNEAKLKSLIGITGTVELEQIDFSAYEPALLYLSGISDEDADALFERFWSLLAASNPSFARAALNSQRAEHNLSLAKRDYAPTISATIFSGSLDYSVSGGFGTSGTGGITIRGTIPLDFWVLSNRIEERKIARDSAALDYISNTISLEMELQTALLNTFAQAGSVLSSRRSLEYNERLFEYEMERYRLMQSSVSDLGSAATSFINARNSHTRAIYGFLQSISRLRSLCAMDDEQRLIELLLK